MNDAVWLGIKEAEELSLKVLTHNGYSLEQSQAITRNVLAAQIDECHSHGLYRLVNCVDAVRSGVMVPDAVPVVQDQGASIVRVNAEKGSSLLAFEMGSPILIDKAKTLGLSALAINNSFHFSALWPEVESLAKEDLVALALTVSHAYVAPAGGKKPLFGTNPFAFSWPRPHGNPYTFDFATSVVARGEIELHRRAGNALAEGWAIDSEGNPTTDPATALEGAMLPFGGYKGSALSTMIELLAGPLIGDFMGHETKEASKGQPFHGELIIAFSPDVFLGPDKEHYFNNAEKLFENIQSQGARLPSQRRYEARERSLRDGLSIPLTLYEELNQLTVS